MKTSSKLTFMIAALLSLLGNAEAQAVTSCEQLATQFRSRYFRRFNFDSNLSTFDCNGATGKIVQSIWDLETLKFRPNGDGQKPDFFKFFYDVVEGISYSDQGDCAGGGAIAAARSNSSRNGGRITFCPSFLWSTREDRLMTLIHESKHLYRDSAPHVTCEAGPNAGAVDQCDVTLDFENLAGQGAFGMELYFANWLLVLGADNDLDMSQIRSSSLEILKTRFNNYSTPKNEFSVFSARDIYDGSAFLGAHYVTTEQMFIYFMNNWASWLKTEGGNTNGASSNDTPSKDSR